MATESARLAALRDRLLEGLRHALDDVRVNGSLEHRLPHNLHVSFDKIEGESLLMALGDLAVSTGSACSSGSQAPSHVLQSIGAVGDQAGASIRFASAVPLPTPTSISRSIGSRPSSRACGARWRALILSAQGSRLGSARPWRAYSKILPEPEPKALIPENQCH